VIISVPSEITQVERRAVIDSAYRAKAAEVYLVEQAMMAAIGAGLPVTKPVGNLVVDIGGGTSDVALISMSGIVYSRSLRTAGNHMDESIMNYVKRKYNLLIGERMAEQIKIEIGSASALEKPVTMEVKGRSLIEGIPKTITVDQLREGAKGIIPSAVFGEHMGAPSGLRSPILRSGRARLPPQWKQTAATVAPG
jgi:rod shape-determining protein MreB